MEEKLDPSISYCKGITRLVYLLALFSLLFQSAPKIFQSFHFLSKTASSTSATLVGTSFFLALYICAMFFVIYRAYWVISGKTRLESPYGGSLISSIRTAGIALMYIGVGGQVAIWASMAIHNAPSIFAIFALPFSGLTALGLLLFESGRILAFEKAWPNKALNKA